MVRARFACPYPFLEKRMCVCIVRPSKREGSPFSVRRARTLCGTCLHQQKRKVKPWGANIRDEWLSTDSRQKWATISPHDAENAMSQPSGSFGCREQQKKCLAGVAVDPRSHKRGYSTPMSCFMRTTGHRTIEPAEGPIRQVSNTLSVLYMED